jgi:hypothetical protein
VKFVEAICRIVAASSSGDMNEFLNCTYPSSHAMPQPLTEMRIRKYLCAVERSERVRLTTSLLFVS